MSSSERSSASRSRGNIIRFSSKGTQGKLLPAPASRTSRQHRNTRQRPPSPMSSNRLTSLDKSSAYSPRVRRTRVNRRRLPSWLLHGVQLAILGIGLAVVAGTLMSNLETGRYNLAALFSNKILGGLTASSQLENSAGEQDAPETGVTPRTHLTSKGAATIAQGQEIAPLKEKIHDLVAESSRELKLGVFLLDLDDNRHVSVDGAEPFSAASTIKVPVLVAFFQDVDAGKIRLDEILTMREDLIASGSGAMQYSQPGSQYTALATATEMIVISDNTATNMLIDRMGGEEALNQRFKEWGLASTEINNPLPDLEGTNLTSPRDLSYLLTRVARGELVSMRFRDRILDIMRQPVTKTLLPPGLGAGATIAHKTGDIGSMVGDTGLIDIPNGKRYAVTAMVKRPHNDNRAQELIRQTSRVIYNHLESSVPPLPTPVVSEAAIESAAGSEESTPVSSPETEPFID